MEKEITKRERKKEKKTTKKKYMNPSCQNVMCYRGAHWKVVFSSSFEINGIKYTNGMPYI